MNMRGDNEVKRRGKNIKDHRGQPVNPYTQVGGLVYHDYLQNIHSKSDIIFPYPRPGKWIYPKPGFIQWKKDSK